MQRLHAGQMRLYSDRKPLATAIPGFVDRLFPDDADMQVRLRDRHEKIDRSTVR
jgi:hypothetical protein